MPAQPHITRNAATTRPNPWLLLWLVPWLFFSVASGGLHDHDRHSEARLPCVQASEASISNKNTTPDYAQTAQGSAGHHDCLACQWSAQSASVFTLPGSPGVPVLQPVPVQPQAFSAPASLVLPALRGRGPPSL